MLSFKRIFKHSNISRITIDFHEFDLINTNAIQGIKNRIYKYKYKRLCSSFKDRIMINSTY